MPLTANKLSGDAVFKSENDLNPALYIAVAFLAVIPGIFENTVTAPSLDNDTGAGVTDGVSTGLGTVGGYTCDGAGVVGAGANVS